MRGMSVVYRKNREIPLLYFPWYRVLVHEAMHETYVAERNLEPDTSGEPILHPLIESCFHSFSDGRYLTAGRTN